MRSEADFLHGQVKARGAVNPVGVEQGHGGHAQMGANSGQFLGQGCTLEKAESRAGVKFDVHQWSVIRKNLATDNADSHGSEIFLVLLLGIFIRVDR